MVELGVAILKSLREVVKGIYEMVLVWFKKP